VHRSKSTKSRRADSIRLPLLITSANRSGARSCPVVRNACKPALIYLKLPSATSSPTLPVVSEWYQKPTADASRPLPNERSFFPFHRSRSAWGRLISRSLLSLDTEYEQICRGRDVRSVRLGYTCSCLSPALGDGSGRSQSETWAGCMVSLTTPTRSSLKASRSVSSLSLAEKTSRVFLASYLLL
jgi:hypothetical protein